MIARIRSARLAGLERALAEVAAKTAIAAQHVARAEHTVERLTDLETSRTEAERRALLAAPFHIEALAAYKQGRQQAQSNIAAAEQLLISARAEFSEIETIRRKMARNVLIEQARKDCLERTLAKLRRTQANRLEVRMTEEFGEGKAPES